MIDRRGFLAGGCILIYSNMKSRVNAQAQVGWAWVAEQLVSGVISYIGGKSLGSLIDVNDGSFPTNAQVIASIRQSVQQIEAFVSKDVRKALAETDIIHLEADCGSVQNNLIRYSGLEDKDRKYFRHWIENADTVSNSGIALCKQREPMSLPTYAVFVNLRTITARAFYETDRAKRPYLSYADELAEYASDIKLRVDNYIKSMDPENRLSQLDCRPVIDRSGGSGSFHINGCDCSFFQDGELLDQNKTSTPIQGEECSSVAIGQGAARRNLRAGELDVLRQAAINDVQNKLHSMADKWVQIANEIRKQVEK